MRINHLSGSLIDHLFEISGSSCHNCAIDEKIESLLARKGVWEGLTHELIDMFSCVADEDALCCAVYNDDSCYCTEVGAQGIHRCTPVYSVFNRALAQRECELCEMVHNGTVEQRAVSIELAVLRIKTSNLHKNHAASVQVSDIGRKTVRLR